MVPAKGTTEVVARPIYPLDKASWCTTCCTSLHISHECVFHAAWRERKAQKEAEARERVRDRDHHNRKVELSELEPISQERFMQATRHSPPSSTLRARRRTNKPLPNTKATLALTLYRWSTPSRLDRLHREGADMPRASEQEADREEADAETHVGVRKPRAGEGRNQVDGNAGRTAMGRVKGSENAEERQPRRTSQSGSECMYKLRPCPCQQNPQKHVHVKKHAHVTLRFYIILAVATHRPRTY